MNRTFAPPIDYPEFKTGYAYQFRTAPNLEVSSHCGMEEKILTDSRRRRKLKKFFNQFKLIKVTPDK